MPEIKVIPLGAGQEVGRSCIILSMGGKNIMLDCGMHMGFNDQRMYPDFSYVMDEPISAHIDCVLISHFHLDHSGSLPYLTEVKGYSGPIYATMPTKCIASIMLDDMRKMVKTEENMPLTVEMIKNCLKKITDISLHQSVMVDKDLEIKPYYAGHVLGAVMFWIKVGTQTVVYTGDYNMTPDRHLGPAKIDKCRPDLLITESTYGTTIRQSRQSREKQFLLKVSECIGRGGKVLIPVFAVGRAQELCILLESYWQRMNLNVPIYFASGMTQKANQYYKLFINWTNQYIKSSFVDKNMFHFKHIRPFGVHLIDRPGPMVVLAAPGMLHGGLSLQIFKAWAPFKNNMIILPGYCVRGTMGHKVINGTAKLKGENNQPLQVNLSIEYLSFSAHTDATGIMQLIKQCEPSKVMLVHGDKYKMASLKSRINDELGLECLTPINGEIATITTPNIVSVNITRSLLKAEAMKFNKLPPDPRRQRTLHGVLVTKDNDMCIMGVDEACRVAGIERHILRFTSIITLKDSAQSRDNILQKVMDLLQEKFPLNYIAAFDGKVMVEGEEAVTITINDDEEKRILVSWINQDEELGSRVLNELNQMAQNCLE